MAKMKTSEQIRAGRAYMAAHGFDPHLFPTETNGPCCFIGSARCAEKTQGFVDESRILRYLKDVVGGIAVDELAGKWPLLDALAAMDIAADLAEADGD